MFLGAFFVFWIIQNPESVLRRQSPLMQTSSDFFKNLTEVLKEPDSKKKGEFIEALQTAYSNRDEWVII